MKTKLYLHPITKDRFIGRDEYFNIMFGDEYMQSDDKGGLKEYYLPLKN